MGVMKCPMCFGTNGQAACARIFRQVGDAAPVLQPSGRLPIFDADGGCLACGAQSINVIVRVAGVAA